MEVLETQTTETSPRPPLTSFSSVDYTMPSEDKEAGINVEESLPAGNELHISLVVCTVLNRRGLFYNLCLCNKIYQYRSTIFEKNVKQFHH